MGCLPNIRLYRYAKGERFGKHIDQSNSAPSGGMTQVTVLFYLNGGAGSAVQVKGGETVFYRDHFKPDIACAVHPQEGFACLHSHGDRCLTHEGALVCDGEKFLLRTDVVFEKM